MKANVKVLQWMPRMICILGIFFIGKFAWDSIESYLTLSQQILLFLVYLVPSVILGVLLVVAWKWELAGGILFTLLGLALTPVLFQYNYNLNESFMTSLGIVMKFTPPLIIVGSLFIVSYIKQRKYRLMLLEKAVKYNKLQNMDDFKPYKLNRSKPVMSFPEKRKPVKEAVHSM